MGYALWHRGLDLIFPWLCPGCDGVVCTPGFCAACWSKVGFITHPHCVLCGDPFLVPAGKLCHQCQQETPFFHSHRSLWTYGPLPRKVIFALKYGRQRTLAPLLARWMMPLALAFPVDCIVPVPLHPSRLARRGFNQSALIAQSLSSLMGIPLWRRRLFRTWKTFPQGGFSPQQRKYNVYGAFSCHFPCFQESVLLVDDVYTTGATINACSIALKEAGIRRIHAVTVAKAVLGA